MNQTSLALVNDCSDNYECGDCDSDYQADTISETSYQNEENQYGNETKNVLAVSAQPNLPVFKSVSVVNSNDVHFGNKTVYKGPVTIKQFVYPNGEIIKTENTRDFEEGVDNTDTKNSKNSFSNPTFVNDEEQSRKKTQTNESNESSHSSTFSQKVNKGFHCCSWTHDNYQYGAFLVIGIVIIVVIAVITTVLVSKNLPSTPYSPIYSQDVEIEGDNNIPVPHDIGPNTTLIQLRLRLLKRLQWLAQPPVGPVNNLTLPVSVVIIQHTATESCISQAQCIYQTRHIQTFHIESNGWNDIGYNFLVGGDGAVYEGRGWTKEGAHTLGFNKLSLGVAFIGTFIKMAPPSNMIDSFHKLMKKGVQLKYLTADYRILAHRQLIGTESPGLAFFEVIKGWPHWSNNIEKPTG